MFRVVTYPSGLPQPYKVIFWHPPIQLGSAALMANAIMADQMRRNLLQWEGGYWNSTPVWPQEPNIGVLKSLARRVLLFRLPAPVDDNSLEITFFSAGAFNKLYLITYPRHETSYLFRVTLPVCPFFKTESEVATLTYLLANTSIPVPHVFAWDSTANNELGFEWILMERLGGLPLGDVWRQIPWDSKVTLTERLAEIVNQLGNHTFDRIGSLYFQSALANRRDESSDKEQGDVDSTDPGSKSAMNQSYQAAPDKASLPDFAVGPIFSPIFYVGVRLYLPGDRGPYRSTSEWLKAEINMQLQWVKAGRVEGDTSYVKDFEKEVPEIEAECYRYLSILPTIISDDERPEYRLHHGDLNLSNILVDPTTFEITGIVDWEMINIVPLWRASEYPVFLQDIEPEDDEEPPIPSYEDEEDIAVYTRDQWDYKILRNHFDEAMTRLNGGVDAMSKATTEENVRAFESQILNLSDNIGWAQHWLEEHTAKIHSSGSDEATSAIMPVEPGDTTL